MSYDPSKVAFLDCETGGLDPEHHQIWEVAVIVDDEEHVWQQQIANGLDSAVRLGMVDQWVLDNTGILERYDHEKAFSQVESYERFWTLIHGRHIVGACPWFDSERLHRLGLFIDQLGGPFGRDLAHHYHLIDVENLAVGYIRGVSGYVAGMRESDFDETALPWDSTALSLALGVDPADFEPKHSALADARWAKAIYERIMGPPR